MNEAENIESIYGRYKKTSKRRLDLAFDCEDAEIRFFQYLVRRLGSKLVLDVGANIGLYAVHSLSARGVEQVIAMEASKATYDELSENLALQQTLVRTEAHHVAVSDRSGLLQFYEYGNLAGHNNIAETTFVGERPGSRIVEVQAHKLDDLVSNRGQAIAMKIDVEGHECCVLDGAKDLLSSSMGFLQIEVFAEEAVAGVEERMENLGFVSVGSIKNDYYFINHTHLDLMDELQRSLYVETRRALVRLQELNTMRRQALRALRGAGSDVRKIHNILAFGSDPVLVSTKDSPDGEF